MVREDRPVFARRQPRAVGWLLLFVVAGAAVLASGDPGREAHEVCPRAQAQAGRLAADGPCLLQSSQRISRTLEKSATEVQAAVREGGHGESTDGLAALIAIRVQRGLSEMQRLSEMRDRPYFTWKTLEDLPKHITREFDPLVIVPVVLGFSLLGLMVFSFVDFGSKKLGAGDVSPVSGRPRTEWSVLAIIALTSYRFYTGFLSATWMPYLLAMEGQQLMQDRQSVFMGSAKLIYGLSILLNPIFGLLGDHMAVVSHWSGRRLFLLVGVGAGGLGIYGCQVAARSMNVEWYLAATVLWMLGEAAADVTTETLVPELLPKSQYGISSNIRALKFLLGGMAGYVCLILFRHVAYSWLYYGYLIVMIKCAFLTLCFINKEVVRTEERKDASTGLSLRALVVQAYCAPCNYEGGFPRACLSLFVFSLGSAPMFFLLLMMRDIVRVPGQAMLQLHFSCVSITFFLAAAAASIIGALSGGSHADQESGQAADERSGANSPGEATAGPASGLAFRKSREVIVSRWHLMVASTVLFGVVTAVIPTPGLLPSLTGRIVYFYFIGAAFGFSFGSVYARFQECTWSVLPPNVDIANAMGFAAMTKLAGVGIGNFIVGFIMDAFETGEEYNHHYMLTGYALMCLFCTVVVLAAGGLAHSIGKMALQSYDEQVAKAG